MAKGIRDAISRENRAVGRSGRQPLGLSDGRSDRLTARYNTKSPTSSDDPLCSTTGFLTAWEPSSLRPKLQSVALCSQPVAHRCRRRKRLQTVTKCLQTVALREKDAIWRPDWLSPFPLYVTSNSGNIDEPHSTAAPKEIKFGSSPP